MNSNGTTHRSLGLSQVPTGIPSSLGRADYFVASGSARIKIQHTDSRVGRQSKSAKRKRRRQGKMRRSNMRRGGRTRSGGRTTSLDSDSRAKMGSGEEDKAQSRAGICWYLYLCAPESIVTDIVRRSSAPKWAGRGWRATGDVTS